jgi:RNA polymerase sigma factor (sigma-70 family)
MRDTPDAGLLEEFARNESEAAFAELVRRHVNLVHSAALRHTQNAEHAQEITQAVFIILARKAARLRRSTVLSGWLYNTTRLTAANFRRAEFRRVRREQEAFMQSTLQEPAPDAAWRELSPLLDEGMARLRATDRDAVVLRYFENKSLSEVGVALGVEERAAQKRVSRALEKLRKFFTKRGVMLSAAVIAGSVSANSVQAAPAGLTISAVAAAKGSAVTASTLTFVKGTMKTMTWIKLKFALGVGVAALLAGGTATIVLSGERSDGYAASVASPFQLRLVLDSDAKDADTMTFSVTDRASGEVSQETLHLQKQVLLDQSAIQSASVATNAIIGQPTKFLVDFTLTPKGTTQFAKITRQNIGRRLAIMVYGRIVSAPVIRSEIRGGRGQITGNFTEEEAKDLAAKMSQPVEK